MTWRIDFSPSSLKFLTRNRLTEGSIADKIRLAIRKFSGERINVNIRKLAGEWEGFYRIRVGKLRIIAEFHFEERKVVIEEIDWRGSAYK